MLGKNFTTPWIDEFERADELIDPLGIHTLTVPSELTTEDLSELQREDPIIFPLLDFLDRDVNPTRDDLRTLPLESRNYGHRDHSSMFKTAYSSVTYTQTHNS